MRVLEGIAYWGSVGSLKRKGGKVRERVRKREKERGGRGGGGSGGRGGGGETFHNERASVTQMCTAVWKRLEQRESAYRTERREWT